MDDVLHDLLAQRTWIEGLCRNLVRDPALADDIAQQTWLSALRRVRPLQRPRAWLRRVAQNHARQGHRARQRTAARERAAGAERAAATTDASAVHAAFELQRTVAAAVHALAEPFRTTVLLHHFEGMTLAAIAARSGEPEGTVRWRLFRAHELLRSALQQDLGPDWRQALLPLCGTALRRSGAAALLAGALLVLGGTALWLWHAGAGGGGVPDAARHASAATAPTTAAEPGATAQRASATLSGPPAATTAAAAPANASSSEQRAVLHARLVGDDGTPLPGATLRLVGLEHSGLTWQSPLQALLLPAATADGNGDAALVLRADARLFAEAPASLLPAPGECWRLRLQAQARGHLPQSFAQCVVDGDDLDLGTVRLAAATALRGRVVDRDGNLVAGAELGVFAPPLPTHAFDTVADLDSAVARTATGSVLARGRYEFDAAPRGPVCVAAVADGYRGAVAWCQVGATPTTFPDLVLEPRPVDAAPPPNQHVLVVDPSGSPVADAPVYQHHAYGSAMGRTDQEGRVWFGSTRTDAGWDRDACGYCAIDPRGVFAAAFVPSAPRTAELLTLRLLTSRRVEVAIERPAGIVAEPTVSWQAVAPAIGTGWLRADADGRYRFAPPPFAAALVVQCDGCRTHEGAPQEAAAWAEHATVVLARQSAGTSVRGKVLAAGRALPAARVQVLAHKAPLLVDGFRRGEWRPETGAGVATGADGTFTLRRDDGGELRLLARADGFAPAVTDVLALAADTGIEAPPLELGRGGTLRGRARLASGSPAARRVVAVNSELFGARTTVTARDGAFTFEHLAPGGYELRPCDRDLDAGHAEQSLDADAAARLCAVDVTIADGATTACELVVDGYALELQLVAAAGEGSFAGWTATLRTPHDAQRVAGPVRVGSDGRATLCSHRGGEHVLELDAPGGPFGAVRVTAPVELGAAPLQRRIELDLVPWRSADALPPGSDRLWLGAQTAGLRIGCPLALDAAGHATAALAPVGAADLRADGKVIATVVVRRP